MQIELNAQVESFMTDRLLRMSPQLSPEEARASVRSGAIDPGFAHRVASYRARRRRSGEELSEAEAIVRVANELFARATAGGRT